MKIILIVGHRESSQGAMNSKSKITEFKYNSVLASKIKEMCNHECVIAFRDDEEEGYYRLPSQVNSLNGDLIISLHCNAFNKKASGHEVLYWHNSVKSKYYAKIFNKMLDKVIGNTDRGIKPIKHGDRGSNILRRTNAPCILIEPFFIDNNRDMELADVDKIATGISYLLNTIGDE